MTDVLGAFAGIGQRQYGSLNAFQPPLTAEESSHQAGKPTTSSRDQPNLVAFANSTFGSVDEDDGEDEDDQAVQEELERLRSLSSQPKKSIVAAARSQPVTPAADSTKCVAAQ